MKKALTLIAFVVLGIGTSLAGEEPKSLFKEINRKIKLDFSSIQLNQKHTDYVVVKFKIVKNEIKVLQMNGSQEVLIELIEQELNEMIIKSKYEEDKTYRYKFTFQKEA